MPESPRVVPPAGPEWHRRSMHADLGGWISGPGLGGLDLRRSAGPGASCAPVTKSAERTSLMHLVVSGGMSTLTATLPGTPASVAIARRLVREALPDCARADDLILAVSELASNAIVHSASGQGGTVRVRVRTAPRWAQAEVTGDGPAAGVISPRDGWGLEIIAGVTDRTGALIQPDGRRTAWAEVTWAPGRPGETHTAGF